MVFQILKLRQGDDDDDDTIAEFVAVANDFPNS